MPSEGQESLDAEQPSREEPSGNPEEPNGESSDVGVVSGRANLLDMPYKDPDKQRSYKREWQRANRRGDIGHQEGPGAAVIEISGRMQTPSDVLAVLEEQIDALRRDKRLRTVERARAIGQAATLCLKVIETRDVEAKLDKIDDALKRSDIPLRFAPVTPS